MKNISFVVVLAFFAAGLHAQNAPSDPLTKSSKAIYSIVRTNVLKAAEEMPEENYSFQPTKDVRTFGQLIGHVADAQYEFCSPVVGDSAKSPGVEKNKTSKADLIEALKTAYAYCDKAYDGLTDVKGAEIVDFFGHKSAKLSLLDFNTAHTDEHYGNIVTYLRLKGLVPPSSKQ